MRLPNPLRWLRDRNAARASRRAADAARIKGDPLSRTLAFARDRGLSIVVGERKPAVLDVCDNCGGYAGGEPCIHPPRAKGGLFAKDQTPDLEPLGEDDRALLELGGPFTLRPDERLVLASGRIATGWELAQLARDLVTLVAADEAAPGGRP